MKRIINLLLSAVLLILLVQTSFTAVAAEKSGAFEYTVNKNGSLTITAYNGSDTDVRIPEKLDGKTVEAIGVSAFSPSNGAFDFARHGQGKHNEPSYVDCIRSIYIPKTVSKIDFNYDGYNYKSVNFCVLPMLESITADKENKTFSSENGVLFNKDKTELLCYPSAKPESYYIIPDTVKTVSEYSFCASKYLSEVKIGKKVTAIEFNAFVNCFCMKHIFIPENVKKIGSGAFGCQRIRETSYSETLTGVSWMYPVEGFEIYGCKNSDAEKYVNDFRKDKYIVNYSGIAPEFFSVPLKKPYLKLKGKKGKALLKLYNYEKWDSLCSDNNYAARYDIIITDSKGRKTKISNFSFDNYSKNKKNIKYKNGYILWSRTFAKKDTYRIKYRATFYISGYKLKTPWSKVKTVKIR